MSIDTLLEAARYLEWQAQQQQQVSREEEDLKKTFIKCPESRITELVTLSSPPIKVDRGEDSDHKLPRPLLAPPPPSLPPPQVPIAVIPMVPVVTATPSVPPLPLTTQIAAAATALKSSPPAKNASPPQLQHQPPASHPLLCGPDIKLESSPPVVGLKTSQSQTQIEIKYSASITTNGSGSHHALAPHQAPPASQPRPNGVLMEDMRTMEGKRRPGGAGTREVHNILEKHRRAHLKECFETLKKNVPNVDEKKTSNLSVLRSALRYIQTLKRKEKEYEHEMERLAREKIATQQRLAELKNELSQCMDVMEIDRVLRQTIQPEDDQASTSTASEGEDNFEQDIDDEVPAPAAPAPKPTPPAVIQAPPPPLTPHLSIQHTSLPLPGVLATPPSSAPPAPPPPAIAPAPPPPPPPPQSAMTVQPTVIAHAAVSHPSVIQAVSHALPTNLRHLTHIAPSPGPASSTPQPSAAAAPTHQTITAQPIGHITVHPVTHLGAQLPPHLPTLYPQSVSVSQTTMVSHIAHSFAHHTLPHVHANPQANTPAGQVSSAAVVSHGGKPTAVLAPHPQPIGQAAVLNPVTMVTVPMYPVNTLKLA
ncbi:MAX network transcriptional repressor b [Synchiropus splendidus]|uniref:MAX network transcriptional repressor b n=1 Tax=Synchiropus splendidus TaxID=270530 RepID=UPI00237E1B33|nr:MAX network transcriptional repressor b [Synchiropus splendidus]